MDRIHILIVDDHTLFRKGIRTMLEAEEDMEVVGEAATGQEALEQTRTLVPDVVLMDIKMPDMDGVGATRILRSEMPHVGIIFCTMFEDDEFVFAGLKAGGRGYILKESDPETMLRAIRAVACDTPFGANQGFSPCRSAGFFQRGRLIGGGGIPCLIIAFRQDFDSSEHISMTITAIFGAQNIIFPDFSSLKPQIIVFPGNHILLEAKSGYIERMDNVY